MIDLSNRTIYGTPLKGFLNGGALIPMPFVVFGFIKRARRFRHPITRFGLFGSTWWLIVSALEFSSWMFGLAYECHRMDGRILYVLGTSGGSLCLYTHFLLKARLLNGPGQSWTNLQIMIAFMLPPIPIMSILLMLFSTEDHTPQGCIIIPHPLTSAIMALFIIINNFLPAVAFFEGIYKLVRQSPQSFSQTANTEKISRMRLFWSLCFHLDRLTNRTVCDSTTISPTVKTSNPAKSKERPNPMKKQMRILRHVLLSATFSFVTTALAYAIISSKVLSYDGSSLLTLEHSLSWCFAILASPLPQENGRDRITLSTRLSVASSLGSRLRSSFRNSGTHTKEEPAVEHDTGDHQVV